MIKRIVILQDDDLVVRELTRTPRPAPAYAVVAEGARDMTSAPTEPEDLESLPDDEEDAVTVEPVGEFELKGIRRPIAAYNVVAALPPSP